MKIIDQSHFMDTFQYFDKPIVLEIIDIFIDEYPERKNKIKKAVEDKNFEALKFDAHSIKGVIANFSAPNAYEIAKMLEMKGAEKDDSDLELFFEKLVASCDLLIEDLKELRPLFIE